jgi:hypothetical protein
MCASILYFVKIKVPFAIWNRPILRSRSGLSLVVLAHTRSEPESLTRAASISRHLYCVVSPFRPLVVGHPRDVDCCVRERVGATHYCTSYDAGAQSPHPSLISFDHDRALCLHVAYMVSSEHAGSAGNQGRSMQPMGPRYVSSSERRAGLLAELASSWGSAKALPPSQANR